MGVPCPTGHAAEGGALRSDTGKTKRELLEEIDSLRQRLAAQDDQQHPHAEGGGRASAYQGVLEDSGSISVELDEHGAIVHASSGLAPLLGYSPDEVLQRGHIDWIHQDDRERLVEQFVKLVTSGGTKKASFRLRHKDGHWKMLEVIASPYRDAGGGLRVVARGRDTSSFWQAEKSLRETREHSLLLDMMSRDIIMMILDDNDQVVWANSGFENLLGYSSTEFKTARQLFDLVHPHDREKVESPYYEELKEVGDTTSYGPYRFRHKDGSYKWFEGGDRLHQNEAGERLVLTMVYDVTRTQAAVQELRESEERYRIIDEIGHDIILLQGDEEGRLIWANAALRRTLGITKEDVPTADSFFERVHPEDVDRVTATFGDGYAEVGDRFHYEPYRVMHKDGSWRWLTTIDTLCENESGMRWSISATRDITDQVQADEDRRKLAQQINETQRLESLGVMAGGIAHDFNNLLTPILGESSLALLDLPSDSALRLPLQKIQKAARRAAALTNQMLAYSGQGPVLIESIDLSVLVEEMGQLLESTVSGRAVLNYSIEAGLPPVEGDSAQLSQIVMNLISNAAEALEECGGQVHIRTGVSSGLEIDREHIVGRSDPSDGLYVFVEVTDNGPGMKAETKPKIFDPFFTTKFTGRGLGLASVVGIVRGHQGLIVLDSEEGRGTRFQVLLPAAPRATGVRPSPPKPRAPSRTEGTVLVIDDDEGVRDLADVTLRRAGLEVLLASDGGEGLELFRLHAHRIQAVILDRTMPTIGGDMVFEEIRRIRPDATVILMSGYSEDIARERIDDLDAFLHKPFEPSALLDTLQRVVARKFL